MFNLVRILLFSPLIAMPLMMGCDDDSESSSDGTKSKKKKDPGSTDSGYEIGEGDFSIEVHLASDEEPDSPGTIGIVTWSIEDVDPDSASIQFGLDDDYGMTAPVDLEEDDFRTLLLGMKPNKEYHFRIEATEGDTLYISEDQTVETGPSTNLVVIDFEVLSDRKREPGFIITNQAQDVDSNIDSAAFIIDPDGDIVWWYEGSVGPMAAARMSYDAKNMWFVPNRHKEGIPIQRVRMDTLESEVYKGTGGSHDITPVEGETMAFIDYGEDDCGSVFEIKNNGRTKEIFESTPLVEDTPWTPCHLNAVRYNEEEEMYTVSDRAQEVWMIDRDGDIHWELSEIVDNESYGAQQHGHQMLPDSFLLFANSGGGRDSSTVLEFSLDDGDLIWDYDGGVRSVFLGDTQRLPGGNTLVVYSNAGVIHEVDDEGDKVLEITADTFGYGNWRPTLYGPPTDVQM